MLFVVAPSGHERYIRELGELMGSGGPPDQAAIADLRRRHDIEQLTPLNPGRANRSQCLVRPRWAGEH
jgi:hypothetical protein